MARKNVRKGLDCADLAKRVIGADLENDLYQYLSKNLWQSEPAPAYRQRCQLYGPTILELGTDEQKEKWLPGISRGEGGWAMELFEPSWI